MSDTTTQFKLNKTQNIFLVGPMGAGKTTIGRHIARELNRAFFDSDVEITKTAGADLAWIYDIEGEQGFRDRETKILETLTQKQGIVLATGGGAILSVENRRLLASRGLVIYLEVSVTQQVIRTEKDKRRPSLRDVNRKNVFEDMQQDRQHLYESIADLTFTTDAQTVRKVAKKIVQQLLEIV